MAIHVKVAAAAALMVLAVSGAQAQEKQENYASWPPLQSTFESTGGNGIMIKGYDPVINNESKCVTTFMAVEPNNTVYYMIVEYDTTQVQGGTLCDNGKWRAADGGGTGTTPFRMFVKGGVWRRSP